MSFNLYKHELGPWPMNCYIVHDVGKNHCAIVDPGADGEEILNQVKNYVVECILITHGHPDHISALDVVRNETAAPVFANPIDAGRFNFGYDVAVKDGQRINLGEGKIKAIYTPGHTAGMTSFDLGDNRILVGDTIFVGGPGKTWTAEEFETTMRTMAQIVFKWSDEVRFYPGHGLSGLIGEERPSYDAYVSRGWSPGTHGDITWK
jgi:hydroxyacylglutathione hydrolase